MMHTLTVNYHKQWEISKIETEKTETPEINFQCSPKFCGKMFTSRGRQNKKAKYIIGICAVIFVYIFLFTRYQSFEYQEVIKNVKPETVWEYVADFSKMKSLNPTILEFKVLSDHGNIDDWKYSVEYIEKLSHWPYFLNKATGNYHVKKVIRDRKYLYLVESTHKTCFFGVYCGKLHLRRGLIAWHATCQFSTYSKVHRRVPNHRSQQLRYALYRDDKVPMPALFGIVLSKGSGIPTEKNHVQSHLSFFTAATATVV